MPLISPKDILQNVVYSTIATTGPDGSPWAAPMFTAYDPQTRSIYWCAARDSQHCQNIQRNPKAYIAVYDSTAPAGEGAGLYLQCAASEVVDEAVRVKAHSLLKQRHVAPYWGLEDLAPGSPITLFEAHVESAWINDDRQQDGHFVLYRKPIGLSEVG